jgi:Ca2+-binding EF-hand superfamily protein
MEKSKEEFVVFIHQAVNDHNSPAYQELYTFLVACFVRADKDMDGTVTVDEVDTLINEAAALPRRYGFAPTNEEMYSTDAQRKAARVKMFREMTKDGHIKLETWISWATEHIVAKASKLSKDYLGDSSKDVSKEEFITFIKKAVKKGTPEYRHLYFFLLKCFQEGDINKIGAVDPVAFDKMIEAAAAAPRRFGLAPKTSELFPSHSMRLAKRREYFKTMDKDGNGLISFNEWLDYAYKHIMQKVATLY